MSAHYWIARQLDDVIRQEPRNVEVVVTLNQHTAGRFYGADEDQKIDGRRIKGLAYPDVYRQRVQYWRNGLADTERLA